MEEREDITTSTTCGAVSEWRAVSDPKQAGWLFSQDLLHSNRNSINLFLSVDIRQDKEEQDQTLIKFYKRDNVQWTSPLRCKLLGDVASGSGVDRHMMSTVIFKLMSGFHINLGNAAITKVFEGEPDHLIPSVSESLLDNNMFAVAGRMIGHSFLHHGPSFPGLSPAIIHILFGGSLETTPVTIRDCPDLDIRDAVKMLDGDAELNEFDAIHQLSLSWDLPAPNATNRKWLSKKLLLHAMVLDCITWPTSRTVFFESYKVEDDGESNVMDVCRVSGYLKTFIENASPAELKSLIKFWIGWEVPATEMKVEIVEATLPTASTCFEKLRLPRHYKAYKAFRQDLCACISTSYSGFGCA
ncbi:uncharacterized protein LOC126403428 isoform X2 [Epinephelus moara]|uniref:uncharacterized protein LOC126403428 isoform X2 n=1 Tax=Epinephelus moara TaxID=300413 RepID=UPI00214EAD8A|nr:uncharacterized protein LOC126403428 isoform X2 [Epinephelus moara]